MVKYFEKISSIILFMIGERIKELRIDGGLSQAQLAKMIGVSQKAIDYWERGVNEPKASYVLALSNFFEVSCDYLLGKEN